MQSFNQPYRDSVQRIKLIRVSIAEWTDPAFRQIFESNARRNFVHFIPFFRVIDVATTGTDIAHRTNLSLIEEIERIRHQ
jgi:hypothetical protein